MRRPCGRDRSCSGLCEQDLRPGWLRRHVWQLPAGARVREPVFATVSRTARDACAATRVLVKPGAPSSSYLVNKLSGVDMCSGTRMPKGGSSWTATQMDTLRAWIGSGAAP
jgi:hypothetical protein